jgi:HEPN domain-containing protein
MKSNHDYARGLVLKAEHDFRMATLGLEHEGPQDTICFHLQQTVEKLLKALLVVHDVDYPLPHDLPALLALAAGVAPELEDFRQTLGPFASYAVEMRYEPLINPDREEVLAAFETTKQLRALLHRLLPKEVLP